MVYEGQNDLHAGNENNEQIEIVDVANIGNDDVAVADANERHELIIVNQILRRGSSLCPSHISEVQSELEQDQQSEQNEQDVPPMIDHAAANKLVMPEVGENRISNENDQNEHGEHLI